MAWPTKEIAKEYSRQWYLKNRDRILAKEIRRANPGKKRTPEQLKWHREYMKNYCKEHPEYNDRQNKLRYIRDCNDKEGTRKRINGWRNAFKVKIIRLLGAKCACCGEETFEFLCIDHINGGGNKHRKEFAGRREAFWRSISNDPEIFTKYRVLCHNCNMAHGFYGYCPHEREVIDVSTLGVAC